MTDLQLTKRVLIVEDALGVARALKRALSLPQGGGYWVDSCDSAETALEQLGQTRFDLLICDLRLPGMSGFDLLEQAYPISPETRSILITAFGTPKIEERARRLTNAYLPKPFRLHDLIRVAQRVLNQPDDSRQLSQAEHDPAPAETDPHQTPAQAHTHLLVLALDLEGTLAQDGQISLENWDALRQAKMAGLTLILTTGSRLARFIDTGPYDELFEAIVAENGAVVYFPRRDSRELPFGRLSPQLSDKVQALNIPLEQGEALIATRTPHDRALLNALRGAQGGAAVEYNREAVMLLPSGATKGTGLQYALQELGFSARNVVACGEAENDRSLFETAELAVAMPHALAEIQKLADVALPPTQANPIQNLVTDLLAGRLPPQRSRPHRRLRLGYDADRVPVHLDAFELLSKNLGVFGASGSGKSWLAGLLAEELLKHKYQVCIVDPEGDYRALGTGPHSLLLGGPNTPLPAVPDVVNFFESSRLSLVLDLSAYSRTERTVYVLELLRALRGLRARRGRPHWFLIDEVQSFCPPESNQLTELLLEAMQRGGFGLVSYRPSQTASSLLQALDHWLVTRLRLPEELQALQPFFSLRDEGSAMLARLSTLPQGQAYLCLQEQTLFKPSQQRITRFHVGDRKVTHVRHRHKYLRAPLPETKRFYFKDSSGRYLGQAAASLWEFREALNALPVDSLSHHLSRGDFERWISNVLHDDELARRVRKIDSRDLQGEILREALLKVVAERYTELDSLA